MYPVLVPWWGLLHAFEKMSNFPKFLGGRPRSKFSTRETTKPIGNDMKMQRDELTSIQCQLENM